MKKVLLFTVCVFVLSTLHAQNASFGVQAGVTFPSFKSKTDEETENSKTKVGFTIGVVSNIKLGSSFSFQPALNFTQKGGKVEEEKKTFNYLELPLNFVYNTNSKTGSFFVGVGPSLGFGLSGKGKGEDEEGEDEGEDINFGSGNQDYKVFDLGANAIAGYKFQNGIFIAANYTLGLSDLSNVDIIKFHNRYFALRVGFMFGGKAKK